MSKSPRSEYTVAYVDRIYGWKTLFVSAYTEAEAIDLATQYVGFTPHIITACLNEAEPEATAAVAE